MQNWIRVNNLSRRFGPVRAVDRISFSVAPGEVVGFLGPNGAGKTTTMRMLAGYLRPSGGEAAICDHDVVRQSVAARRCLGYLAEGAPSYPEMRVGGFLRFVCDMHGGVAPAHLEEIITTIGIDQVLGQRIETLSKGYRRRVGLAAALAHDPKVLILDEPTDGLDPNQKYEVRERIAAMAKHKAIIVSTHILEEVEAVCSRAIVINHGRIIADTTPADLLAISPTGRLDDSFRRLTGGAAA